jgi:hypothetical protein
MSGRLPELFDGFVVQPLVIPSASMIANAAIPRAYFVFQLLPLSGVGAKV